VPAALIYLYLVYECYTVIYAIRRWIFLKVHIYLVDRYPLYWWCCAEVIRVLDNDHGSSSVGHSAMQYVSTLYGLRHRPLLWLESNSCNLHGLPARVVIYSINDNHDDNHIAIEWMFHLYCTVTTMSNGSVDIMSINKRKDYLINHRKLSTQFLFLTECDIFMLCTLCVCVCVCVREVRGGDQCLLGDSITEVK